jgi:hypothetical protein
VAIGTLIPAAIEAVFFVLPYAMHTLHVGPREWARHIAAPALLPVLPQAVALFALDRVFEPTALLSLAAVILAGWVAYISGYLALGASPAERELWRRFILRSAPS